MRYVDVTGSGAVLLGDRVVCDGFQRDRSCRVQTHVHDDHMGEFERSKGLQNLYMSDATRSLLIAEFNADLQYRDNVIALAHGKTFSCDGGHVKLLSSGHMLGAVQVELETPDGRRLGYSGDFHWPVDDVIRVDALVVDSTYGNEVSVRSYSQAEAETSFLQLVFRKLGKGAVHVKGNRGTIQRAMEVLSGNVDVPVIASARLCRDVLVYQRFGCAVCDVTSATSDEGKEVMKGTKYVRLYSKGDRSPVDLEEDDAKIVLTAFMNKTSDPVMEFSDRSYSVALSDHADFGGTLEYIAATGAKYVVTDNTRRGGAVELALAIKRRLGIEARPSSNLESLEWGIG